MSMAAITDLTPDDAEQIARGLSEQLGREIMTDWVEVSKERIAGRYTITVVEEDVMAAVREYRDSPEWATIREPMMAGYRLNGRKQYLRLDQHGQLIGMSTAGKSALIHCMIAYATRCRDAIVWVGGVQKLYDLVAGWIEVYKDTGIDPPIDWIAHGKQDTLHMMAALMNLARWRQAAPMSERGGWPVVIFIADEVSFVLEDHTVSVYYDGSNERADAMATNIMRGSASGDCAAHFASQHDVNACFGDRGGTLAAQFAYTAAFKIRDKDSIGRLMGDWKLAQPRFPGEFWLDAGDGQFPVRVKAEYIQSVDRSKPRLHNGQTVADVAWARRHFPRSLDTGSALAAGKHYARRLRRIDDAMLDYVRGQKQQVTVTRPVAEGALFAAAPEAAPAEPAPPQPNVPDCDRELAVAIARAQAAGIPMPPDLEIDAGLQALVQALVDEGAHMAAEETDGGDTASVSSMVGRQSLTDRILAVVQSSEIPLTRKQIIAELEAQGHPVSNPQVVSNALDRMRTPPTPVLARTDDGYRAL